MSAPGPAEVTVHLASLNTRAVTELCIRSLREHAGMPFDLVVGDCGSTDGSLEMLQRMEAAGWLRLEVAPEGRRHPDWLDHWLAACTTRYLVFSDSDVEYREPDWLVDMLTTARTREAALVCGRMQRPPATFVHPKTGAARRLAPRPTPWLLLLDLEQLRGRVDASFRYEDVSDPDAFGGKVAYDVGAAYFRELERAGLTWTEMPMAWQSHYRHYGGLTWLGARGDGVALRRRVKQLAKLTTVRRHLGRARRRHWGEPSTAP
ncbi:MAG: glycosyltransferase family 2 protein [Actinomycetota bacterium]